MIKNISLWLLILFPLSSFAEIKVSEGKIFIKDDKNFEAKLETKTFEVSGKEAYLNETGFIVASAQSSFENDRFISRWVTLSENVLAQNEINLYQFPANKGSSYGVLSTSKDFESDLKVGQQVTVKRYGLTGDNFQGRITKISALPGKDVVHVHFIASSAPELIAGTTCEVEIPHIKKLPFRVSLLSLLHLGLEDYIVVKSAEGTYYPKHVTIIDQDSETATILAPISKDLPYVARGAILLKPLLNRIIIEKGDGQ